MSTMWRVSVCIARTLFGIRARARCRLRDPSFVGARWLPVSLRVRGVVRQSSPRPAVDAVLNIQKVLRRHTGTRKDVNTSVLGVGGDAGVMSARGSRMRRPAAADAPTRRHTATTFVTKRAPHRRGWPTARRRRERPWHHAPSARCSVSTLLYPMPDGSVAVCVTGLVRSLLAPVVVDSYAKHLVKPLERDGFQVDTYISVVGVWRPDNESLLHNALLRAYARSEVSLLPPETPRFRCPPHHYVKNGERFLLGTTDILVQFVAIHSCYMQVSKEELRRAKRYSHLMRVRTDMLYLSDLPTSVFQQYDHVFVAASGMGPKMDGITCMNDHMFLCPRTLCRPYFNLLEIFQSDHCVPHANASHYSKLPSIFATKAGDGRLLPHSREGPLTSPFLLSYPPKGWFTSQWYIFARYTAEGHVCAAEQTPEKCCGAMREFEWWYTLAKVVATRTGPTVDLDCKRIKWSYRGQVENPALNASVSRCHKLEALQAVSQKRTDWSSSPFVATYRPDCMKKWSCSRTDRHGVANLADRDESDEVGGADPTHKEVASPGGFPRALQEASSSTASGKGWPSPTSVLGAPSCPADGDLQDPVAFDAMMQARASSRRLIVLMLFGEIAKHSELQTGVVPVYMAHAGRHYVQSLVRELTRHRIHNHLVVTATGRSGDESSIGSLCRSVLRPLGLCCGWSSAGHEELKTNKWGWSLDHPHWLKLQLWWVASKATARGYDILTLDYDIFPAQNPLEVIGSSTLGKLDVAFAADAEWPVQPWQNEQRKDYQGAVVDCKQAGETRSGSCVCGRTPAPMINTAFCHARASAVTAALFGRVASTIIDRLGNPPPQGKAARVAHAVRLWEQDVINEVVFNMSRLPLNGSSSVTAQGCHLSDQECRQGEPKRVKRTHSPSPGQQLPVKSATLPPRWWASVGPRTSGVWLAEALRLSAGECDWQRRELIARTELVSEGRSAHLGILPRSVIGRLCARRKVPLGVYGAHIDASNHLPCDFYSTSSASRSFLGQAALHAQSGSTARALLEPIQPDF